MKQLFVAVTLIVALCGFNAATHAQTVVILENLDSQPPGPYGTAYTFSGGTVTANVVSPGQGGAGQALQLSGNVTTGTTENAGVDSPYYTPSGNISVNPSDYTLLFDLAIPAGANSGLGVTLNIYGGTSFATGSSYDIPISQITVGGGFQHFSVNIGSLSANSGRGIAAFDPSASQYQFELVFLGYNATVTATPETVLLDNLQITTTVTNGGNTNSALIYVNPPIYADYPDPDIIRVGDDFYFTTTTFIDVPGLTVLHSQDLVHWEIVSHIIPQLTGSPNYNITNGVQNYGNGVFASSIRYYNGTFYVVDQPNGQPNALIYHTTNIYGPWQSNVLNTGAFDPGLFIETNGTAYIVTAGGWQSNTTVLTLNSTFSSVIATHIFTNGLGLEGSHVYKRGTNYYIFNSQPATGNLYVSRATNIFGPYTFQKNLDNSHGGHQGGIVDMPDGSDYGFNLKDSGTIGRMTYISPIFWTNGWPVWGTTNAPGQIPATAPMPIAGAPAYKIATSDDFSSPTLGLQWQFNHNPDNTRWSLTQRPGFLRLYPTGATNFWFARNTLIQKGQGPWSSAEVKFDLSNLQPNDICGLGALGKSNGVISVTCNSLGNYTLNQTIIVSTNNNKNLISTTTAATAPYTNTTIYLRLGMDFNLSRGTVLYSSDGRNWTQLGGKFNLAYDWYTGTFQGEQFAMFCYNPAPGAGYLDVDWFHFVPPAFINDIVKNPDSSATLYFANSPGFTNVVQASSDLSTWQNVSTNLGDANGFWQFTDTNASAVPVQFYRSYTR